MGLRYPPCPLLAFWKRLETLSSGVTLSLMETGAGGGRVPGHIELLRAGVQNRLLQGYIFFN